MVEKYQRAPVAYPDPKIPVVAYLGSSVKPASYHQHTEADWELCYIGGSQACLRVSGTDWLLREGDLFVIRPDEPHACVSWRGKRRVLIARRSFLKSLRVRVRSGVAIGLEIEGIRIPRRLVVPAWRRGALEHVWERLQKESFSNAVAKPAMCASLLGELLLELARIVKDLEGAGEHPIDPSARALVEGTCADVRTQLDYPWTLSEMSRRSGYSPTQLSVLFRTVTGMSPCQWLAHERVQRACEMLTHSDQSVTQIAIAVGFGSRSQFHRVFRRLVGATPDRYRAVMDH